MTGLLQEFRFGMRMLLSRPAFSIAIILTLAIGIGANTAIFSVVNGLLLKPLPYTDGERLVQVYNSYPKMGLEYAGTSIPDYLDRREQAAGLDDLAMYTWQSFNLGLSGRPERLVGLRATPSLFSTLREPPLLGRVFVDDDAVIGQEKVVILSNPTWQNQFGADPEIIGRELYFNGDSYQVVGVMREGFAFPNHRIQVYVPFAFSDRQKTDDERGNEFSASIGRLKPGATVEQLNDQLKAIVLANADRLSSTGNEDAAGFAAFLRSSGFLGRAKSLRDQWVGDERPVLWLLQAVVIFVLLIACANVANLMLTRMTARKKELSVRTALGAGRFRIIRQLLIEALLISTIGAVAGVLLANWSLEFLELLGLNRSRLSTEIGIDGSVLAFTMILVVVTTLLFGLFPALAQFKDKTYDVLKEGGRGTVGGKAARLTRNSLVVIQILLAVTLMIGAGLLIKSFYYVQDEDPGFKRNGLLTVRLDLSSNKYQENEDYTRFYERALEELDGIPGAKSVGYSSNLPFSQSNWTSSFRLEGKERIPGEPGPHGYARSVDEDYFKTMGIPLLEGRLFLPSDIRGSEQVLVVDEIFARKHFPNESAVGQRMIRGDDEATNKWRIIGVVGTTKVNELTDVITKESYYFTYRQFTIDTGFFIVESDLPPASIIQPVRDVILRVDPEQPLYDIKSIDERIAISLEGRRAPMLLLALFSGIALLLSVIGVYGVLAFSVAQRTSELGVRMALGAGREQVFNLVLGQGARLVFTGVLGGVITAFALTRVMQSLLFGVGTIDLVVFGLVSIVLAAVAMLACLIPARKATRIQPIEALRYE